MRLPVLLALALLLFLAGIATQALRLTAGLSLPPGGVGAFLAACAGAALLFGLFILLMRRQHRRDRDRAPPSDGA